MQGQYSQEKEENKNKNVIEKQGEIEKIEGWKYW